MAFRTLTVAAILLGSAFAADAQQSVRLEFNDGKVTLSAREAPLRAILAEWARLGGATVVNGDRVVGQPVTLELTGVPERQALDVLLRGVSGYMIAPRPAGSSGASMFDRILILPTSVAPRNPPPAPAARPGPQRPPILRRPPQPSEAGAGNPQQEGADGADEQEPATAVQPLRPGDPRMRPPIQMNPANPNTAETDDAEEPDDDVPAVKPTPSNPFGIPAGSSAMPGVVTPLPQGAQRPGPARVQ
jgi:hypothetical protein